MNKSETLTYEINTNLTFAEGVLEEAVANYITDMVENGTSYGTLHQDKSDSLSLDCISHKVESIKIDEFDITTEIKILDTPKGEELRELLENEQVSFGLTGIGSFDGDVISNYKLIAINPDIS